MRIAIDLIGVTESGSAGGSAYLALVLTRGLAKRCEVIALCSRENEEYLRTALPSKVPVVCVMSRNPSVRYNAVTSRLELLKEYITIHRTLAGLSYDLLFCPLTVPTCWRRGIPLVATIHDLQHEFYPQFFGQREVAARRKIYRHLVERADGLAAVSDYTREVFCRIYHYPEERIITIYNSIQGRFADNTGKMADGRAENEALGRWKLKTGSYIIYPANFWENKNHRRLLEAFADYIRQEAAGGTKENRAGEFLVLTGSELSRGEELREACRRLDIEDHVVFAGHVSDDEMGILLRHARGLIYPSLYEGFGIPVAEAMEMDLPVACSNATSLPEVGGEAVFYFDPSRTEEIQKGISWLFTVRFTKEMHEAYQKQLEKFSYDRMIDGYYQLIEKCIRDRDA